VERFLGGFSFGGLSRFSGSGFGLRSFLPGTRLMVMRPPCLQGCLLWSRKVVEGGQVPPKAAWTFGLVGDVAVHLYGSYFSTEYEVMVDLLAVAWLNLAVAFLPLDLVRV